MQSACISNLLAFGLGNEMRCPTTDSAQTNTLHKRLAVMLGSELLRRNTDNAVLRTGLDINARIPKRARSDNGAWAALHTCCLKFTISEGAQS